MWIPLVHMIKMTGTRPFLCPPPTPLAQGQKSGNVKYRYTSITITTTVNSANNSNWLKQLNNTDLTDTHTISKQYVWPIAATPMKRKRHFDKIFIPGCTGSWKLPVQPVMKILSKWHFSFSDWTNLHIWVLHLSQVMSAPVNIYVSRYTRSMYPNISLSSHGLVDSPNRHLPL